MQRLNICTKKGGTQNYFAKIKIFDLQFLQTLFCASYNH